VVVPDSDVFEALVSPEEFARADWDALQDRWLALLDREAESPVAELVIIRLRGIEGFATRPLSSIRERLNLLLDGGIANPLTRGAVASEVARLGRKTGAVAPRSDEIGGEDEPDALRAGLVIGPFGTPGAYLHDWVFPPEHEIDIAGRYPGLTGEVGWVPLRLAPGDVRLFDPTSVLPPGAGATYTLFQVSSEVAQPAWLRFESDVSVRVFFDNGGDGRGTGATPELVLDSDRLSEFRPRRAFVPIGLAAGWNRILVKTTTPGAAVFSLRLLDPVGAPLRRISLETAPVLRERAVAAPGGPAALPATGLAPDARALLVDRGLAERPNDPALLAAAATFLDWNREDSESIRLFGEAFRLEPKSATLAYLLGDATQRARHLPSSYRTARATSLFREALRLDPDFLPARFSLALLLESNDRAEEAVKEIRSVLATAPRHFRAHLVLGALFAKLGWKKERLDAIQAAEDAAPGNPAVENARVRAALDDDDVLRATERLERSLAADVTQDAESRVLASIYRSARRFDDAIAIYERLARFYPRDAFTHRESIAATLREKGDLDGAVRVLRKNVDDWPKFSSFARTLGDYVYEAGRKDEALAWYRRALEVDPGFHEVRDLIDRLTEAPDLLFAPNRVDAHDLIAKAPGRETYPRVSSVAVLDDLILRIYRDGSTRSETHQAFKLLDRDGVEDHASVQFDGEPLEIRTWLPSGETLEPIEVSGEDGYTMPGVVEGATVEYRYRDDTRNAPGAPLDLPTFYFQDVDLKEPFLFSRYVVVAPKDMPLTVVENRMPSPPRRFEVGNDRVTIYLAKDMERIRFERHMPDPRELLPYVTVGQERTWEAVNQIFKSGYLAASRPTAELVAAAREAAAGAGGERLAAERLYAYANERVTNEEGRGDATAVLVERQGSRLILFLGLLRAAGIEFEFGRARVSPELDADNPRWEFVRESLFGEPVIRVLPRGSEPVFVAFGPREMPFGRVPPNLFGARVFLVGPGEGRIETIPRGPREEMIVANQEVEIVARSRDAFGLVLKTVVPNVGGLALKEQLKGADSGQRLMIGRQALASAFPGAVASDVRFPGLDTSGAPLSIEVEGQIRSLVDSVGGRLGCTTGIPPLRMLAAWATGEQRTWPVIAKQWNAQDSSTVIDFGESFRAVSVPEDFAVMGFLGRYELTFRIEEGGRRVVVRRRTDFGPVRVPPSEYPALLRFCRDIDDRESERVLVEETVSVASGAGFAARAMNDDVEN
jgi:tetratricopeptide (TPR) repeat protein